jgi:hypothetical protein
MDIAIMPIRPATRNATFGRNVALSSPSDSIELSILWGKSRFTIWGI